MKQNSKYNNDILRVNISSLSLRNPTILASGFLGISQELFNKLYRYGVGAVVSKSISTQPMEGYKNPTVVSLGNGSYLNAVGLSNPGAESFSKEVISNKQVPLIISLVGSTDSDFLPMVKQFDHLNICGYEINLSCPHVTQMGMEVGDDPEMVNRIIKTVKSYSRKPLFVKVGVGNSDIIAVAQIAKDAGADGITAINTIRAMTIDIETSMPILSNRIGGLSGKPIKSIGIRCVYEISKKLKIPVIGCGGVFTWEDAVEFMLAGASAIQLGSVIGYEGIIAFSRITSGIKKYLERKGLKNAMELIGLAHKY